MWKVTKPDYYLQNKLSKILHIQPLTAQLLINRGFQDVEDARLFLKGDLRSLPDYSFNPEIFEAVRILAKALKEKEKILIYGDYDVDGISATVLMVEALSSLGSDVVYHLPERNGSGYGLNAQIGNKALECNCSLILTVDCGITAIEEVREIKKQGLKVIITDHHQGGDVLPEADAVINPVYWPDCELLAGVGVAYILIAALNSFLGYPLDLTSFLDLVALGTVADSVTLKKENRILVKEGLQLIQKTKRAGLKALLEQGHIGNDLTVKDLAFYVNPKLNAAGRLGNARLAAELLLTHSENEAWRLATDLKLKNYERKNIEEKVLKEAISLAEEKGDEPALVLASPSWHYGILGIVAAKLAKRFNKAAFVMTIEGEEAKGSARSNNGLNLLEALQRSEKFLTKYGGHKKAAGFSLDKKNIPFLEEALKEWAKDKIAKDEELILDAEVSFADISRTFLKEIGMFEPFGVGNPEPLFSARGVGINSLCLVGRRKEHLKLELYQNDISFASIGFGLKDFFADLQDSFSIDIAFLPFLNFWQGEEKIELEIKDLAGHPLVKCP